MNWTAIRAAGYVAALVIGAVLTAFNIGSFDPETGMVTLHPFNLYELAAWAWAAMGAPAMAAVAVMRGWGRK